MDSTNLKDFLELKGFFKVKLKLTKTNHFLINANINGVKGRFILDTGASNSCIDFESAHTLNLNINESDIKGIGAGSSNLATKISRLDTLKIGKWITKKTKIVILDLHHVNNGLALQGVERIDGIIGADILKLGKCIIDYSMKRLYLKPL